MPKCPFELKFYLRDCGLVHAAGMDRTPLHYRTQDGAELDLVFERAGQPFVAIEIKRSTAPKIEPSFGKACDDLGVAHRLVVYGGQDSYDGRHGARVLSLEQAVQTVSELFGNK